MRVLCIGYLALLTVLLLVEQPLKFLGLQGSSGWALREAAVVAHLVSFLVLTLLVLAARWPVPRGILFLLMGGYALGTELLQAFVPSRTPEVADLLQDLAGIGIGGAIWWVGLAVLRRGSDVALAAPGEPIAAPRDSLVGVAVREKTADRSSSE